MQDIRIKKVFEEHFKKNMFFGNHKVQYRLYNSDDNITSKFSTEDWNMIFTDVDEQILKKWLSYKDRVLLIAMEKTTGVEFGFICIEESPLKPFDVFFHGGVWIHNMKTQLLSYEGTDLILHFLVYNHMNVYVTCYKWNKKADRFQKSLGFVEYYQDEKLSYKELVLERLNSNVISKRRSLTVSHAKSFTFKKK